jgi:hypothetical protein
MPISPDVLLLLSSKYIQFSASELASQRLLGQAGSEDAGAVLPLGLQRMPFYAFWCSSGASDDGKYRLLCPRSSGRRTG